MALLNNGLFYILIFKKKRVTREEKLFQTRLRCSARVVVEGAEGVRNGDECWKHLTSPDFLPLLHNVLLLSTHFWTVNQDCRFWTFSSWKSGSTKHFRTRWIFYSIEIESGLIGFNFLCVAINTNFTFIAWPRICNRHLTNKWIHTFDIKIVRRVSGVFNLNWRFVLVL